MELIRINITEQVNISEKLVMAIGQFDGLHLAHQKIIEKAVLLAKEKDLKSAVLTFEPHPDFVLGKRTTEGLLTPLSKKQEVLESLGVDYLIVINFTKSVSKLSPAQFEEEVLLKLNLDTLVAGFDYRYGHFGKGDVQRLISLGKFNVEVIAELKYNNEKMGSTLVRNYLTQGRIEEVSKLLGRYYSISGRVMPGNKVGRELGFKTANIALKDDYFFLKNGVYAAFVNIGGKRYLGACNIGNNPSVNYTEQKRLEVHILDFDEFIYDEKITVEFVAFIRDEVKFTSIDELIAAIDSDVKNVRLQLGKALLGETD